MGKSNAAQAVKIGDRVVPHAEAATMLGLTPKALYHVCYRGEGPKHVIQRGKKGKRSYLLSEIMELIEKQMRREGEG